MLAPEFSKNNTKGESMEHKVELAPDETEVLRHYRGLSDECKECVRLLLSAAWQYSPHSGTVIDFVAHMTAKS